MMITILMAAARLQAPNDPEPTTRKTPTNDCGWLSLSRLARLKGEPLDGRSGRIRGSPAASEAFLLSLGRSHLPPP